MAPKVDDSKGANPALDLSITKEAIRTQVANKEASDRKGVIASKGVMLLRKVNMKTDTAIEPSKKEATQTHILQQSVDKSKSLGVAPLAAAHLNTPAASNFVNELDQKEKPPYPKMNVRNAEQSIEHPKNCCCRGAEEDSMEGIGSRMPVKFPGFSRAPHLLAVAGSESGTVESLNRVLSSAFKVANPGGCAPRDPGWTHLYARHQPSIHRIQGGKQELCLSEGHSAPIVKQRRSGEESQ